MTFLALVGLIFFIIFGFRALKLYQTYIEYLLTPEEIVEEEEKTPYDREREKYIRRLENIVAKYQDQEKEDPEEDEKK